MVGVVAAFAAAVPFIISTDVVKRRISDQITHWTGRAVTFEGDPKISLFPYLTVKLHDVKLANPPGIDWQAVHRNGRADRKARDSCPSSSDAWR